MKLVKIETLVNKVENHIDEARNQVVRAVNHEMLKAYWFIGRDIVEEEQKSKERAEYGKQLLSVLSAQLTKKYKKGFSVTTLKNIRTFYLKYQLDTGFERKGHTLCDLFKTPKFKANLGWSQYRILMRIADTEKRAFYEAEAAQNNWSARELQRQSNSFLYERMIRAKKPKEMIKHVNEGVVVQNPEDIIKDPYILEFLNLPESHKLSESNLEQAIIDNLQEFLLELGKGFAFVARQKRLTLDGEHYYTDLVFYHIHLKCYVIIDLKTKDLHHADIGQMQLYTNYFDQEIKDDSDNPTIGLVLCTKKRDKMVRYMLGENQKKIFTSEYQLFLPTEQELVCELQKVIEQQTQEK